MNEGKGPGLKILHVVGGLNMGGAETWLIEMLKYWKLNNIGRFDFLITGGQSGIFDEEAKNLGSNLFYVKYSRSSLFKFIKEFRKLLMKGKYNAIHDHNDYTCGWHFLWGTGLLPRVRVAHVHNPWMNIEVNYNVNIVRKFTSKLGKKFTRIYATDICGTSKEVLLSYDFMISPGGKPRVSVLHCGINVQRFNNPVIHENDRTSVLKEFNWTTDNHIVLFAGRLDQALEFKHPQNHKNSWLALHIIKTAMKLDSKLCFIMAGAGVEQQKKLQEVVESWGLSTSIKLVGIRHDLDRLMRASALLLFPSAQEGLGMVAVEAQASGLPVLASDKVPKECKVVDSLFHTMELDDTVELWSNKLVEILRRPKPSLEFCGKMVNRSPFSIEHSSELAVRIYRGDGFFE